MDRVVGFSCKKRGWCPSCGGRRRMAEIRIERWSGYCVGCHNSRLKTGGLAPDGMNFQAVWDDAAVWEKALRKLRGI